MMGFVLGKLGLGKIQLFAMIGLGVALAAASFALYKQVQANGRMVEQVKTAAGAVEEQRQEAAKMRAEYEDQLARFNVLQLENNKIQREKDRAVRTLGEYRGRLEAAATARTSLVARRATRATRGLMCEFHDATGGQGSCGDREGAP